MSPSTLEMIIDSIAHELVSALRSSTWDPVYAGERLGGARSWKLLLERDDTSNEVRGRADELISACATLTRDTARARTDELLIKVARLEAELEHVRGQLKPRKGRAAR